MRADFLDFAIANTLVRLHFDKERNLERYVQVHSNAKNLSFH
jgi:hypothetical protein